VEYPLLKSLLKIFDHKCMFPDKEKHGVLVLFSVALIYLSLHIARLQH
jgi:hypothetical protein